MDVHTQQQQIEGYCRTLALSIYYTLNVHRKAYININTLFGIPVPTPDGNTFPPLECDQKAGAGSL